MRTAENRDGPSARRHRAEHDALVVMDLIRGLKVRNVMTRSLVTLPRTATLREAQELMRKNNFSGVPIAEDGRLYGIVSIYDIIQALDGGYISDPCLNHMSTHLIVLEDDMPVSFALGFFENYKYGRFPVLDKSGTLVGIVSQRDISRVMLYELTKEVNRLERARARVSEDGPANGNRLYMFREFPVVKFDFENAGKAANEIKRLLHDRGMDSRLTRRIAVAAYELEMNICVHSVGGTLSFVISNGRAEVVARDRGPGIENIEWACRGGTSTANEWIRSLGFGAGMGLVNTKRVSDEFDITSTMGRGTTVRAAFKLDGGAE